MQPDYRMMSLTELKEEARKKGLKGVSTMKKQDLAALLIAQTEKNVADMTPSAPRAEEAKVQKAETSATEHRGAEERRQLGATDVRRPASQGYQERTNANPNNMRRPVSGQTAADSADRRVVQQPRPAYNAQSSTRPAPQEGNRPENGTVTAGSPRQAQPDFTTMSPKELWNGDSASM